MNHNGGGGMGAGSSGQGLNHNPNIVSIEERQKQEAAFDKKIVNDPLDQPYIYRERLKQFALALSRHDEATGALNDSRLVQLCFHLLRRLDEVEARIAVLEKR